MKHPRPDGLSQSAESVQLQVIEDDLTHELSHRLAAVLAGRITTQGRREMYFYAAKDAGLKEVGDLIARKYPGYECEFIGSRPDPEWTQYFDVIYPSTREWRRINDRDLVDVFERDGDDINARREVRHWIYFASEEDRAGFNAEAEQRGFRIARLSIAAGDDQKPFCSELVRVEPISWPAISGTTLLLSELAERRRGNYDGWEAPVLKNSEAARRN
jgi:hypothetical protein